MRTTTGAPGLDGPAKAGRTGDGPTLSSSSQALFRHSQLPPAKVPAVEQ
ncbi:hypothetical protein ABIB68_000310 [Bradyrhizobium sp. F1.2.2]